MISHNINILLADDDKDDCMFFQEALEEVNLPTQLTIVYDGEQLMQYLTEKTEQIPNVLFLDLNMPRKNGFTCLEEIKRNEKLKTLPVIIFSTSYNESSADILYKNGAHHYICKPSNFEQLKKVILQALILTCDDENKPNIQPPKEEFLLSNLKTILL